MSYATYITDAYVCGTFNRNTADRSYLLFTREAGMLFADAKSAREERSRQRYALQDFSRIRVSLVKGRQGWKVGSVEALGNDFMQAVSKEARGSVVALYRLLRRFIHGEEPHPELFDFLTESLGCLRETVAKRDFLELYVETRVLAALGYVNKAKLPTALLSYKLVEIEVQASHELTRTLRYLVAQGMEHSQL